MSVLIFLCYTITFTLILLFEGVSRFLGEPSVHTQPNVCPVPPPYLRSYLADLGSDVSNLPLPLITPQAFDIISFHLHSASIAVPAVAYRLIFNSLRDPDDIFNRREEGPFFQARVASLGVFVGVCLIFFVPLFLWKRIGQKRVDSMVRRWGHDDVRVKGQGEFIPVWKVNMPGVFSTQAVCVSLLCVKYLWNANSSMRCLCL